MPRICPEQLLNCLKVLLAPNGGIKSEEQIDRLVSLIQKYSTKLVSKCIYISILKATDEKLINEFMKAGGWTLLHNWLDSSVTAENWPLSIELLELLRLVPVDLDRLKSNTIPKLVKTLSKQRDNDAARLIATDLIGKWASIVKAYAGTAAPVTPSGVVVKKENESSSPVSVKSEVKTEMTNVIKTEVKIEPGVEPSSSIPSTTPASVPKLKISLKDVPKVSVKKEEDSNNDNSDDSSDDNMCNGDIDDHDGSNKLTKREKMQKKYRDIKEDIQERMRKQKFVVRIDEKESPTSSSPKPSVSKVKTKDVKTKLDKASDKKLESVKDKKLKDLKSKEKIVDPIKTVKEKVQAEKDKANLAKALPAAPVVKLGKIPKKAPQGNDVKSNSLGNSSSTSASSGISNLKNKVLSDDKDRKSLFGEKLISKKPVVIEPPKVVKKVSISIEPKRNLPEDAKLKTVKTFNSKFRLTGLEEEPPKPPITKKPSSSSSPSSSTTAPSTLSGSPTPTAAATDKKAGLKRLSPPREQPPEKKPKVESSLSSPVVNDKKKSKVDEAKEDKKSPGGKKPMLLESVGFMDALDAANIKAEPRRRKRKPSKESNGAPEPKKESSPTSASGDLDSPKVPVSPPVIKPFKFYQETMETSIDEDSKTNDSSEAPAEQEGKDDLNADAQSDKSSSEEEFRVNITENETPSGEPKPELPKSALVHFKSKKDAKRKSVTWREEECLISVKYFDLDETERVNVTRNFNDMKNQERYSERENFLKARNLASEDIMEEKTPWRVPTPIKLEPSSVIPGKNSQEKEIQFAREKTVLQAIYFNRRLIPDSPAEPDLEIHATTDPMMIPLEDTTGSTDSIMDFTHEPWPEPKRDEFDMSMPNNMMMPSNNFMYPAMNNAGFPCGPFPPGPFPGAPNALPGGDWRGPPDPNMPMFPGNRPGPGPMGPGPPMGPMGPGGPGPGPMGPVGPMGPMGMGPGPADMGFPGNFDPSFGPGMGPGGGPPNMFNGPGPGPGWFDPGSNNVGPPQPMMNMNSDFGPPSNMPPRNNGKNRNDDRPGISGRGDGGRPWKGKDRNKNKGKGSFKGKDYSEEFALRHGICKMYLRKGTCPFTSCKFLHTLPNNKC